MKQKLLNEIDNFVEVCYMMFKIGAGDFAKENFPKIVENFWNDDKTDQENLQTVKNMFEANRKLNETPMGNPNVAQVIKAFQDGWLNKLEM